jgi:Zn-dependent M28 family amino/carboxypeptidase
VAGDSIYNGADDNASGTAAVIELAQAFAGTAPRPRRSMIFLLVSGEEKGLWGSRWYAENPTFPIESTVANINIDMIGRNWTDSVVAIGKEESTLGASVERVAADHPELGVEVVDDQWPDERFYYRSDHYNFARQGVPILFFFTGTHEDYHRPSDEPERIGYEKMTRITRLLYYLGLDVANAPEKPEWDEAAYQRVVEGGP